MPRLLKSPSSVQASHLLRFLISTAENLQPQVDDASTEEGTNRSAQKRKQEGNDDGSPKKPKLNGAERQKLSKEEKRAQRGSNKGRRWAKVRDEVDLCWRFAGSGKCDFGSECVFCVFPAFSARTIHCSLGAPSRCRFSHDIHAYLNAKPRDIFFPSVSMLSNEPPFVSLPRTGANETARSEESSVDSTTRCPVFEATGSCRLGLKCRFLGGHVRNAEDGTVALVEDEDKKSLNLTANTELNFLSPTTLKLLRTKKVEFILQTYLEVGNETTQFPTPVSDGYLQELKVMAEEREGKEDVSARRENATTIMANPDVEPDPSIVESNISDPVRPDSVPAALPGVATVPAPAKLSSGEAHAQADLPDVPFRFSEKRRLNWSNKTCMWSRTDTSARDNKCHLDLGPLTTVGNLVSATGWICPLAFSQPRYQPFRRLCVSFGADITCGESEYSFTPSTR